MNSNDQLKREEIWNRSDKGAKKLKINMYEQDKKKLTISLIIWNMLMMNIG